MRPSPSLSPAAVQEDRSPLYVTHKQRMLAALRGEPTDKVPWAPRMDLWYNANKRAGTLPAPYQHASLSDIVDDTGMGFHAVVPHFKDLRSPDDEVDRALGIHNLKTMPYRTVLDDVERDVRLEADRTIVKYATPVGEVQTVTLYDEGMRKAGISITHVESHAFKQVEDYAPLCHIFRHARIEPQFEQYAAWAESIGERGIAVAYMGLAASPAHFVMRDLMPLDTFFFEMHDHPDDFHELVGAVAVYYAQLLDVARDCPADVVFAGANYDASVTYPPFFAQYIQPWLKRFADALHPAGKFLLTHTDGENDGLLELYVAAGIDVADSVCPRPMTKLTLRQAREVFAGRVAIMGGLPSVTLLPSVMSDAEFDRFLDAFFEEIGAGDHLILGVSDTTPPEADFQRLLQVGKRVEAFGPVP